ncbi:MAG: pilus assembly protein TadG-related protein [Comamonas sp.]|jgi:hypothetical protein|nr:pilus assembly protein TadG-related protein [Comamonas sp.]
MKHLPHSRPTARPLRGSAAAHRRQHGAFLITFALFMLFLLGFMGIALDFGRLFVVKTELQTAADSCALAAARELDLQPGAVARAISAGGSVGGLNGVQFQSGKANQINIGFSETLVLPGGYSAAFSDNKAKYAECSYALTGLKPWLLQAMGAFSGNSAYANNLSVAARAVATRAPSQSACIIPVALRWDTGLPAVGQWIPFNPGQAKSGNMTWGNLNGSTPASTTEADMLSGYCVSPKPGTIYTPGTQANKIAEVWNYRFGIYKNQYDPSTAGHPDYSSFSYTTTTWKTGHDAYQDFLAKRLTFTACGINPTACGLGSGGYSTVLQTPALKANGADRRIVTLPITSGAGNYFNNQFACMLMLTPLQPSTMTSAFEYLGLASDPSSPCKGSGIAGGTAGPVVPTLVR